MKFKVVFILLFGLLVNNRALAASFEEQLMGEIERLRKLTLSLKQLDLENSAGPVVDIYSAHGTILYRYGEGRGLVAKFCNPTGIRDNKIEGNGNINTCSQEGSNFLKVFDSIQGVERRNILADYERVLSRDTLSAIFGKINTPYNFVRSELWHLSLMVVLYKTPLSPGVFESTYNLRWKVADPVSFFKHKEYVCDAFVRVTTNTKGQVATQISGATCLPPLKY